MDEKVVRLVNKVNSVITTAMAKHHEHGHKDNNHHHDNHRAGSWHRPGMTPAPPLCSLSIRVRSKKSQPYIFLKHHLEPLIIKIDSISGDPLQHCLPWWERRPHQECKKQHHSKNAQSMTLTKKELVTPQVRVQLAEVSQFPCHRGFPALWPGYQPRFPSGETRPHFSRLVWPPDVHTLCTFSALSYDIGMLHILTTQLISPYYHYCVHAVWLGLMAAGVMAPRSVSALRSMSLGTLDTLANHPTSK